MNSGLRESSNGLSGHQVDLFERQSLKMVLGPASGLPVTRPLGIIDLLRNHLADKDDHWVESLSRGPYLRYTNGQMINIGVKHGGEHFAACQLLWVVPSEDNVCLVNLAVFDLAFILDKAPESILYDVPLWWITKGLDKADPLMVSKKSGDAFVFGLQSAQSKAPRATSSKRSVTALGIERDRSRPVSSDARATPKAQR